MTQHSVLTRPVPALIVAGFVLAGCGSQLNPFNWFGGSREVVTVAEGETNPLIPAQRSNLIQRPEAVYQGVPVDQVTELRIERTRSGAIVLASGLAARQGASQARLSPQPVAEGDDAQLRTYVFNVVYPAFDTAVGPETTRQVTVAQSISAEALDEIRTIRVVAARNARETRR